MAISLLKIVLLSRHRRVKGYYLHWDGNRRLQGGSYILLQLVFLLGIISS
jgi:hypothetical protein